MENKELTYYLEHVGKDPSRLIFEDELTGLFNRRFLFNYFKSKIPWEAVEEEPVSLLMMDVDHFKSINDTFGHDMGDQALTWVAGCLKEAAGEEHLPIRYAGDEFMILMPKAGKARALELGENLIKLIHTKRPLADQQDRPIVLTLSLGVATAPEDARDEKALIQKADTALYFAKKAGRDRLADTGQVDPQEVSIKTALHQLGREKIAGRKKQLGKVAEVFERFGRRQSQFLIVEGEAGLGKSTFLEKIQNSLSPSDSIQQVKVAGSIQELHRPYYLITSILITLLNRREDRGAAALSRLSKEELTCLYPILPHLNQEEGAWQKDQKIYREGIFATLLKLFREVVEAKHTVLLIDDLHLADEATLLLLRRLIVRKEFPLFVCGTARKRGPGAPEGPDILERFCTAYGDEIGLQRVPLTPLGAEEIVSHLEDIFPRVNLPAAFGEALAKVTQGNPLFLREMVRKLVVDGKIALAGDQWVAQPLEERYFPRSLEEIIRQKISALDEASREILSHVSVMGDTVSMSTLTGSAERGEARIQESIDNAISQGLISSDFSINDEIIQFLSPQVLGITYGSIGETLREELHECVGNYQETLHARDLLPSAATLAYHFRHSANREKARYYEQIQAVRDGEVFDAGEAVHYSGDSPVGETTQALPLDAESLQLIPEILRSLPMAVRNIRLYPPGSRSIVLANEQIQRLLDRILEKNAILTIFQIENTLAVNGASVETGEFKSSAETFLKFLGQLDLKGIGLKRGLSVEELGFLLTTFSQFKREGIRKDFWRDLVSGARLDHVELTQVQFAVQTDEPVGPEGAEPLPGEAAGEPELLLQAVPAAPLKEAQVALVPEFTRSFLNAARSIRLYPLTSKAIENTIGQLCEALGTVLDRRSSLTFSRVGDALLVNGGRLEQAEFQLLSQTFLRFLDSISLKSITFLSTVTAEQMRSFLEALRGLPASGVDAAFWARLAREKRIGGILFDRHLYYEAKVSTGGPEPAEPEPAQARAEQTAEIPPPLPEPPVAPPGEGISPEQFGDLLLKGDPAEINRCIDVLLGGCREQPPPERRGTLGRCAGLVGGLNIGLQNRLAGPLSERLLALLTAEEDPGVIKAGVDLLHRIVAVFLHFRDYPAAIRIVTHLQRRGQAATDGRDERAAPLREHLLRPLEPEAQQLILADFRSEDPEKRQNAVELLGGLGAGGSRLLIDIIKAEKDLRLRQIAASLLKGQGPEAAGLLRRELSPQAAPDERLHILEIIDQVTDDFAAELACAFGDASAKVREGAFRLAERLQQDRVEDLLVDFAGSEKTAVATRAIRCLGRPAAGARARQKLAALLKAASSPEIAIACCQALGRIGDAAGIAMLAGILRPAPIDRFCFWRKRHDADVRASAASALALNDHPAVREALANCRDDKDPRVREIARAWAASGKNPPAPAA